MIRIVTDTAADYTQEELEQDGVRSVATEILLNDEPCVVGRDLTLEEFWLRLLAGQSFKTSQPAPSAFFAEFEDARENGDDVVCINVSSGVSGTIQSARIAAEMAEHPGLHIVDSLNGTVGQKLLTKYACRLRDEGKATAEEIAAKLRTLRSRVRLFAGLDTLENLGRSGRMPKALASLGNLTHLKPLVTVNPEGKIVLCSKAFGRSRAIDAMARRIAGMKIDYDYPVIPVYSYDKTNCMSLMEKLKNLGVKVDEALLSAIGPSIAGHIGPNVYGLAFVEAE